MYDTPMIFYDFSAFHSLACLQWTCIAHQPSAYNVQALRCIHTSEPVFGFSSCLGTSALKKCGNNFDVLSRGSKSNRAEIWHRRSDSSFVQRNRLNQQSINVSIQQCGWSSHFHSLTHSLTLPHLDFQQGSNIKKNPYTAMDKSKCFLTLKFSIVQTRRDECSAILYQYPVLRPSALITARIRSGMLLPKLEHVDRGVLSHSSARNCLNSAMLRGKRCSIRCLRSPHRFSIGLRSGE